MWNKQKHTRLICFLHLLTFLSVVFVAGRWSSGVNCRGQFVHICPYKDKSCSTFHQALPVNLLPPTPQPLRSHPHSPAQTVQARSQIRSAHDLFTLAQKLESQIHQVIVYEWTKKA